MRSVLGLLAAAFVLMGCAGPEPTGLWGTEGIATVYNVADAPVTYAEGALSGIGTQTSAHTPVPGDGNVLAYAKARFNSNRDHIYHGGHTLKYIFLNTNSLKPPYDDFDVQFRRDFANIHMTVDTFLFDFDWDDPYTH